MPHACPHCGGELGLALGATFARCPYCSAAVVSAGGDILERYVVPVRLTVEAAQRALHRWMVGNEPSRWLVTRARVEPPKLEWLPVWYARTGEATNTVAHEARADATRLPEVKRRLVPASGLRRLEGAEAEGERPPPTVTWETFAAAELADKKLVERALVHVPFYRFEYRYRGRRHTAAVDAATGEVRPGRYPKRPTTPFVLLSLAAITTFAVADLLYYYANGHVVPSVYPFAWVGLLVLARLFTAVF